MSTFGIIALNKINTSWNVEDNKLQQRLRKNSNLAEVVCALLCSELYPASVVGRFCCWFSSLRPSSSFGKNSSPSWLELLNCTHNVTNVCLILILISVLYGSGLLDISSAFLYVQETRGNNKTATSRPR